MNAEAHTSIDTSVDTSRGEPTLRTGSAHRAEDLSGIMGLMLDMHGGRVAYAVLSFGDMGTGGRLVAVPWEALKLDTENERFVLDVKESHRQDALGRDGWPDMSDAYWSPSLRPHVRPGDAAGDAAQERSWA